MNASKLLKRKTGGNFIDYMRCQVLGGKGGDGCVSFFRDVYVSSGPPNGGDGGQGGDVWFVADENETSLSCVKRWMKAQAGDNGRGKSMHGQKGKDLVVKVPKGTTVQETLLEKTPVEELNTSYLDQLQSQVEQQRSDKHSLFVHYPRWEDRNNLEKVRIPAEFRSFLQKLENPTDMLKIDLTKHGQRVLVAQGGLGGLGNPHFNTSLDKQPHYALRGTAGQSRLLDVELKTIADVGLVGMPNAGKSTFLQAVSNAHPKIASYAFTTLNPYIGTVGYSDSYQLTIADIPGLIPDAHRNVGLGHSFLRHVERSKVLAFIVDLSKTEPWRDLAMLRGELDMYQGGLSKRPSVVICNKADVGKRARDNFRIWQAMNEKAMLIPVSAKQRKNITKATHVLRQMVQETL